jgi:hypothetical protein
VRLWAYASNSSTAARSVECARKYVGHAAAVTCVACVGPEVISGAADGQIIVWDQDSGATLRVHQVHAAGRPVFALQFDSVKIVSAGADAKLVVTDVISGEPLQTTLRPHGEAHVLALMFDSELLITVGADRSMRHWAWRGAKPVPNFKLHTVGAGEKVQTIARKYRVKTRDLLRWNGIHDVRRFYEGMRIIVADPAQVLGAGAGAGDAGEPAVTGEHQPPQPEAGGVSRADGVSASVHTMAVVNKAAAGAAGAVPTASLPSSFNTAVAPAPRARACPPPPTRRRL